MTLLAWLYHNFGAFFAAVFLLYLYLIIYRFTALWRVLVNVTDSASPAKVFARLPGMKKLTARLSNSVGDSLQSSLIIDAIWLEQEYHIFIHIKALNAYLNSMILFGFAGTIIGCVNAFDNLFKMTAGGGDTARLFVHTWDSGLNTALYSSLAAALLGGGLLTLVNSSLIMGRCKRLEAITNNHIIQTIQQSTKKCVDD